MYIYVRYSGVKLEYSTMPQILGKKTGKKSRKMDKIVLKLHLF